MKSDRSHFLAVALILTCSLAVGQLYVNGSMITHGPGGVAGMPPTANSSSLQTTTIPALSVFGFGGTGAIRLADDFTVPLNETWTVSSFRVFGYITNNTTVPSAANYRIWCGQPGTAGATILFDFSGANQMTATAGSNIYRIQNLVAATTRHIQQMDMAGNGIVLGPGTYWLDFNYTGVSFTPPITVFGSTGLSTGNAVQFINGNTWQPGAVFSGLAPAITQGLPFEVAYSLSTGSTPQFQMNSAGASLDVDGDLSNGCAPAAANKMVGSNITATFASTSVGGWELGLGSLPLISLTGGGLTIGNQVLNLDLSDPNLLLVNGGLFPAFPFPFGASSPASASVPMPNSAVPITLQMAILDGLAPGGIYLSQAVQLNAVPATATIAGPNLDEFQVGVDLEKQGYDAVSFYGVNYRRMYMNSNGRILFGGAESDFSPSVAEAGNDNPFIASLWADQNPATGTCDVNIGGLSLFTPALTALSLYTDPATVVMRMSWFDVPLFGTAILVRHHIYHVYSDSTGPLGHWVLHNELTGASTAAAFVGLSPGFGVATNPGPQPFAPLASGPGGGPSATAMLYATGTAGTVWGAVSTIQFTPVGAGGAGGYNWNSY